MDNTAQQQQPITKERGPLTARQLVAILAGFLAFLAAAAGVGYEVVQVQHEKERRAHNSHCLAARMEIQLGLRAYMPASCDS